MFSKRIEENYVEKEALRQEKERVALEEQKDLDLVDIEEAIRDFSRSFRAIFDSVEVHERRELLRQTVYRVDVDPDAKVITAYIRQVPFANRKVEPILGPIEKAKLAPLGDKMPVRIEKVPGTGNIVNAELLAVVKRPLWYKRPDHRWMTVSVQYRERNHSPIDVRSCRSRNLDSTPFLRSLATGCQVPSYSTAPGNNR